MADSPPPFEIVACPGCGSSDWTPVRQVRDSNAASTTSLQIVRCAACYLLYTNPRPVVSGLGFYYPDDYSPFQTDNRGNAFPRGIRGLVLRDAFGAPSVRPTKLGHLAARWVRLFRRPESFGFGVPYRGRGKLLDFGCGAGKFLRRMHALGWDVTGLDFSESAVRAIRSCGLSVLQGTLPHTELLPGSFDVIAMRHALEHVPDPRAVLRSAHELLDGNGMLVIQVPNYAAWDISYFAEAALGLDVPRHLTHFTPASLRAMLRREGFGTIRLRQAARVSWIRQAARRYKGSRSLAFVFRFSPICRVTALLCRITGHGNEIIAMAEKA